MNTYPEGSIINIEERVSTALREIYERIQHHVMTSVFCKHFDETSWRDRGKKHYVWIASTRKAVCFHIDRHRSEEAFLRFTRSLGDAPIVSDRYAVYTKIDRPHQYCLAHLIRDFKKYSERDGPDSEIGKALEGELRQICKTERDFREGCISKRSRAARIRSQKKRVDHHLLDGFANGSEELSSFCDRLLNDFSKLWTFGEFSDVDPTNNLAERDLRKLVLWRKKSYGTRSNRGQRFVERISTVGQTLRKADKGIFSYLKKSILAFYQGNPSPQINYVCASSSLILNYIKYTKLFTANCRWIIH